MSEAVALFLFAESPVHAGAGGGEAAVDLPIQRSVQTRWPILNDATIRGGLRRLVDDPDRFFGKADAPGKLVTPDAELVAFPVASAEGVTCWVTCPAALNYLVRKLNTFGLADAKSPGAGLASLVADLPDASDALVASGSKVTIAQPNNTKAIVLESDRFDVSQTSDASKIAAWLADTALPFKNSPSADGSVQRGYWPKRFISHFAIISDAAFTHYSVHKTDIRTRVRIGDDGIVAASGPWTEENLPVDSLLFAVLAESDGIGGTLATFQKETKLAETPVIQLGGDQNLGRGMLRVRQMGRTT